jgi:hypothetical protein
VGLREKKAVRIESQGQSLGPVSDRAAHRRDRRSPKSRWARETYGRRVLRASSTPRVDRSRSTSAGPCEDATQRLSEFLKNAS